MLGPLGEDGSGRFRRRKLNGLLSKEVTPANNGAVAIWQAIGPEGIPKPDRPRFFKQLGIDPLPATGAYFVTFARFVKQRAGTATPPTADGPAVPTSETAFAQESQGAERPWSKTDFPLLADWLAAIDKPLNRVVEGANRPRFFSPIAAANRAGTLLGDPQIPLAQTYRVLARALSIRAMLRVDAGRVDDALEDALACHRLGRLVAQGPFLFDWLAGATIDDRASILDTRIAEYGQISAERAKSYQSELDRLPPLTIANVVGGGERLLCLDFICKAADDLPASIRLAARASGRNSNPAAATTDGDEIDVNAVLRLTNQWYDRAVEALNKPRYSERRAGMAKFTAEIESLVRSRDEQHRTPRGAAGSDASPGISSQAGEFLTCIHLPAASLYVDIDGQRLARLEIAKGAPLRWRPTATITTETIQTSWPTSFRDMRPRRRSIRLPRAGNCATSRTIEAVSCTVSGLTVTTIAATTRPTIPRGTTSRCEFPIRPTHDLDRGRRWGKQFRNRIVLVLVRAPPGAIRRCWRLVWRASFRIWGMKWRRRLCRP